MGAVRFRKRCVIGDKNPARLRLCYVIEDTGRGIPYVGLSLGIIFCYIYMTFFFSVQIQ